MKRKVERCGVPIPASRAVGIGIRIRRVREKRLLSQAQFAGLLHVTQQIVACWEKGENVPSEFRLDGLCRVLGIELGWLLGQEGFVLNLDTLTAASDVAGVFVSEAENVALLAKLAREQEAVEEKKKKLAEEKRAKKEARRLKDPVHIRAAEKAEAARVNAINQARLKAYGFIPYWMPMTTDKRKLVVPYNWDYRVPVTKQPNDLMSDDYVEEDLMPDDPAWPGYHLGLRRRSKQSWEV